MLFNTPIFFLFFAIFFVLYSFVLLRRWPRLLLIVVGSFVFYAGWNYRFIPLLVFSAVVDYFLAIALHDATQKKKKKLLLAASIVTNLGILAVFKYADFAIESVVSLLGVFGYEPSWTVLALVLPVGISFYTFQSMSYTIDVYRGEMEPRKGLLQFTAALSFFPQLVAGPILRAKQILPQLEVMPSPTWLGAKHGFLLISVGLLKKTLADLMPGVVSTTFDGPAVSLLETWTGVLGFAAQIYGDFSGYTDMAIGIGLLLGFQIPLNFRLPYLASSPIDFWRRWHISLSTWLRDYLYISLGGNRTHHYRNIMFTMLLGGLWHGAAWTFVVWGAFHGCIIIATHALNKLDQLRHIRHSKHWFVHAGKCLFTFYLVLLGWVLFRAQDLSSAFAIFANMHGTTPLPQAPPLATLFFGLTLFALFFMHGIDWMVLRYGSRIEARKWILWPMITTIQFFCFMVGTPSDAFIYFQF